MKMNRFCFLFLFLFVSHCISGEKPEWVKSKAFQRFCGCVPLDLELPTAEPASEREKLLGSLPVGALDQMGTEDYLEKVYNGIKNDFEYSGTQFEKAEDGLVAKGIELKRVEEEKKLREILIVIDGDVAFPSGKSTMTPKAKTMIGKISDAVSLYPETKVKIGGHTDSAGVFAKNLKLSKDRAQAVKTEMQRTHQIAEERFTEVDGYADLRKIVDTMLAEPKNRRTEVRVGTVRIVL
ncbi:OmpA family protein [Leptospira idonii]|uniref:OmpA family protein n=2 Tax=Leptospira idonii TaxID=1193500 RepID=A0A4R9M1X4_9LEPT|nr:OmpA family protein [Leptospira idonii]